MTTAPCGTAVDWKPSPLGPFAPLWTRLHGGRCWVDGYLSPAVSNRHAAFYGAEVVPFVRV